MKELYIKRWIIVKKEKDNNTLTYIGNKDGIMPAIFEKKSDAQKVASRMQQQVYIRPCRVIFKVKVLPTKNKK